VPPSSVHPFLLVLRTGLAALLLLAAMAQPRAWDADRMRTAAQQLGPQAVAAEKRLRALLQQAASLQDQARLEEINEFFNRELEFQDDAEVWGSIDFWASPLQSLSRGQADCEDYAIAKYFSLVASGVPQERLRLVYVRATVGQTRPQVLAHMVLAYYPSPEADPLILDNLTRALRPASARPDLVPVFSFNGQGMWQGVGMSSAGDPVARLSRWREVLAKAQAEGFF
jgi:predicted transglutaminase-like cysteine proteinase